MKKDRIYAIDRHPVPTFQFDREVAQVFDDMIHRSVPCYQEIITHQVELVQRFYQPGTHIYDLGCSTGNLGISLCRQWPHTDFSIIAVDNSAAMLDAYRSRLSGLPEASRIKLIFQDIGDMVIQSASVVVLNYTLQFLPLEIRDDMMAAIHAGLTKGGILLFCEKMAHKETILNELQQDFYYAFKRRNGYSELEISQKREALERVLVPETMETHLARLERAGFRGIDVWQKWFNFAAFIAIKQ